MNTFKCRCCGGTLVSKQESTISICEYCGLEQVVPNSDNQRILLNFEKANEYLRNSDFDSAQRIYDAVLEDHQDNALANWGNCMCRYGIRYVDDPQSGKKIPTCSKTELTSIFDDRFYIKAIAFADTAERELFEREAEYIDMVQKRILEIAHNEAPYDIFISFKDRDADGNRTDDSILAHDIYMYLNDAGYHVFFSRITLSEEHLGEEFEPYIYAALKSAKVMLLIVSSKEHAVSPWVKNEWSRYLHFIDQGENKHLIPCYIGMKPADLPNELRGLQSIEITNNYGKKDSLDIIADNIEKYVAKNNRIALNHEQAIIKRIDVFLKNGQFNNALKYCDELLRSDEKNPEANWRRMLAALKFKDNSDFMNDSIISDKFSEKLKTFRSVIQNNEFDDNYIREVIFEAFGSNMRIAWQYSVQPQKEIYENIIADLVERLKDHVYTYYSLQATSMYKRGEFFEASEIFRDLGEYKESKLLAEKSFAEGIEKNRVQQYNRAKNLYESAGSDIYPISETSPEKYNSWYCSTLEKTVRAVSNCSEAESLFRKLGNYKDSEKMAENSVSKRVYFEKMKKKISRKYEKRRNALMFCQPLFDALGIGCALVLMLSSFFSRDDAFLSLFIMLFFAFSIGSVAFSPVDSLNQISSFSYKKKKLSHAKSTIITFILYTLTIMYLADGAVDEALACLVVTIIIYAVARFVLRLFFMRAVHKFYAADF